MQSQVALGPRVETALATARSIEPDTTVHRITFDCNLELKPGKKREFLILSHQDKEQEITKVFREMRRGVHSTIASQEDRGQTRLSGTLEVLVVVPTKPRYAEELRDDLVAGLTEAL